jgi:uncharacterized protein
MVQPPKPEVFRTLSLDGGGAKGFYTLGVLKEVEAMIACPLHQRFDLVYGTSTGAIIAALICLGRSVDDIHALYKERVVSIMAHKSAKKQTAALERLAIDVFGNEKFDAVKTDIGIVATKWVIERPMIFKAGIHQAHGRKGTFVPGFGCTIGEAVLASCSAYPYLNRKVVRTHTGDEVELVDGGYCANNPALYAIADATGPLKVPKKDIRVVSLGVGEYPAPKPPLLSTMRWTRYTPGVRLLQKTLEFNTQSMDQLRVILFKDIPTLRISDAFTQPEIATDLFEHDLTKLNILWQRGRESFAKQEVALKDFLL